MILNFQFNVMNWNQSHNWKTAFASKTYLPNLLYFNEISKILSESGMVIDIFPWKKVAKCILIGLQVYGMTSEGNSKGLSITKSFLK